MLRIIPVINNKGGVGKTTTSVNIAAGLARSGQRTLLVDVDSQGSASIALGIHRNNLNPSSAEVLFGEVPILDAIRDTSAPNLKVLTGSLRLADTDTFFADGEERELLLSRMLQPLSGMFDVVIVDCAPSTSLLSINALVAADAFIIPVVPSYLSLEGVVSLGKVVKNVRMGLGDAAPILGVLLTMVGDGSEQSEAIKGALRKHYGGKVFSTEIRIDSALQEAPASGQSIFDYAPDSQGAADYESVVGEVVTRLDRYGAIYDMVRSRREERLNSAQAV